MDVTKTILNEEMILALDGRLDSSTYKQFEEILVPSFEEVQTVWLDCANLSYISSAGLRALLIGMKTARSLNKRMILKNVSSDVMEVFDMTNFSDMLTFEWASCRRKTD